MPTSPSDSRLLSESTEAARPPRLPRGIRKDHAGGAPVRFPLIGILVSALAIVAAVVSAICAWLIGGKKEDEKPIIPKAPYATRYVASPAVVTVAVATGFGIIALSTHARLSDDDYNTAVACGIFLITSAMQLSCYTANYRQAQADEGESSDDNVMFDAIVQLLYYLVSFALIIAAMDEFDSQTEMVVIMGLALVIASIVLKLCFNCLGSSASAKAKQEMILRVTSTIATIASFVYVVTMWGHKDATPLLVYASAPAAATTMPEYKNAKPASDKLLQGVPQLSRPRALASPSTAAGLAIQGVCRWRGGGDGGVMGWGWRREGQGCGGGKGQGGVVDTPILEIWSIT